MRFGNSDRFVSYAIVCSLAPRDWYAMLWKCTEDLRWSRLCKILLSESKFDCWDFALKAWAGIFEENVGDMSDDMT